MTEPIHCTECGEPIEGPVYTCGDCLHRPLCDWCYDAHDCECEEED